MNEKKLGFGLMRLPVLDGNDPTSIDKEQVCRMVDTFLERGFTYFDTAYMYHNGSSESAVKDVLTTRHPRDSYTLATKMPTMLLKEEADLERIFHEQCEKCGVDYFDYYLIHCLNAGLYETAKKLHVFEYVQELKAAGKVKEFGFSFHDKADVLETILTDHPEVDFVQLQINYLDWDDAGVQSGKCYETAVRHGKKIIVMEPVKGGTLANVPEGVTALYKKLQPELSVPSWAIRFAAGLPNVMMVLSGMSNYEQLLDNTAYMQDFKPLTSQEQEAVSQAVTMIKTKISIGCTACHYCTEKCPKNIAIPEFFQLYNQYQHSKKEERVPLFLEYNRLAENYGVASACVECRQCEHMCPQQLPVVDNLRKVRKSFEGKAAREALKNQPAP
jgi:hypothetical protein